MSQFIISTVTQSTVLFIIFSVMVFRIISSLISHTHVWITDLIILK